jgi:hypothetical protein
MASNIVAAAIRTTGAHLRGRGLLAARGAWVAMTALVLVLFVIGLPGAYAFSNTLCHAAVCRQFQITPAAVRQLQALHLSLAFFAWYAVGLKCLAFVVFVGVAAVVFWRAFTDRTALVAAFTFVTFAVNLTQLEWALPAFWLLPAKVLDFAGGTVIIAMLFVFPNGRFVPRWTRWVFLYGLVCYADIVFLQSNFADNLFTVVSFLTILTCTAGAQIFRYRRVSTPIERQQTKWVLLGVATGFFAVFIITAAAAIFPDLASRNILLYLIAAALLILAHLLIPLAVGVALLRYRLWDVDALVGRVLTYGLLTGLLGAVYVGMILVFQGVVGRFTHQGPDNPLVLVISTLAIAALVQPVRRWLQQSIDRRFYRAKHDTVKTLATFSATLRQQTDLEHVRAQLLAVVDETMRPTHVSLWLRPPHMPGGER